jgi:nucleotide-binding universal stress UspA family protein
MTYKSILTIWDGRPQSRATLDYALDLTRQNKAHLHVLCLGIDRMAAGLYYAGATPMVISESISSARDEATALEAELNKILAAEDVAWSCQAMVAQIGGISRQVGQVARFSDLVILPQPYGGGSEEQSAAALEAMLFEGHAPVLVHPQVKVKSPGEKLVIAWNESSEAMSAIRAALPFIRAADSVDVAIIDPGQHDENRSDPGAELSKMLARHGANVSVSVLAQTVPRMAEVISRHATDIGADLIIMGAYGHSRFRESILGGATRDMLENVEVPVLMAH